MDTPSVLVSSPKPRRWPVALLVALITAIASATLCVPVADWAMEALHVSNMEGGRAYGIVCLWIPLSFLVGFGVGFMVTLMVKRSGFVGYAISQGIALGVMVALICGAGGFAYATADHPPVLNGQNLALDIEVRVPSKGRSVEELIAAGFEVALVVSASDRSFSDLRLNETVRTDEFMTVRAWAPLNSRNGRRDIYANIKGETPQDFIVMRHASPKKIDEDWSEWTGPEAEINGNKRPPADQYRARYRVRYANEYSPTPTPTPIPTPTPEPTPEESPLPEDSPMPDA